MSNELMYEHNTNLNCNVIKTYQMYRKDSLLHLKDDISFLLLNKIKY